MAKRSRKSGKKTLKRGREKARKPTKQVKTNRRPSRAFEPRQTSSQRSVSQQVSPRPGSREGTGFKIVVDQIDGETVIGDLLVVFPRTRGVFQKYGLRLDVEDAGDIYMTLDAFAAMQGIKTETLIRDLTEASREPPPQAPVPTLVASTTA